METIVNKVAKSGLVTLDLQDFYPADDIIGYDIKQNLWQGIALKETDFREFIKTNDWSKYQNNNVYLFCSEDAIIPTWAFMLLSIALQPYTKSVFFGTKKELLTSIFEKQITEHLSENDYTNQRVIIKGCSDLDVPISAYVFLANKLKPIVKSLMFGEACSTVPLYKQPK